MKIRKVAAASLIAVLFAVLVNTVVSAPTQAATTPLVISATVDYTHKTLTITGQNFGSSPTITVDSLKFPTLSSASNYIVGNFPSGMPPSSFAPGTYFLTLQFSNQSPAVFAVDIGTGVPTCTAPSNFLVLHNGAWVCQSRFNDNGNGTVTDNTTGLMWEKQTSTCGGEVTCVHNLYAWSATATGVNPDGTLYTSFLATLNLNTSANGTATCFANHCDWRIPTVVELSSIVSCGNPNCVNPTFGPGQASYYWSSTSSAPTPSNAWMVGFFDGSVAVNPKGPVHATYARAVRGGR